MSQFRFITFSLFIQVLYSFQFRSFSGSTKKISLDLSPKSKIIITSTIISIFGLPIIDLNENILPSNNYIVPAAFADVRAQQKRTYSRYIPKLKEGLEYLKTLKQSIEKEDYAKVEKLFEVYVSKYNPNDQTQVDQTDFYNNFYFYKPMTLLSGTFAERGTSQKQRELLAELEKFKSAMFKLEGCFKDMKEDGFFGATIKKPTGAEKKKQALEAWKDASLAASSYIKVFNAGLMREVNTISVDGY